MSLFLYNSSRTNARNNQSVRLVPQVTSKLMKIITVLQNSKDDKNKDELLKR